MDEYLWKIQKGLKCNTKFTQSDSRGLMIYHKAEATATTTILNPNWTLSAVQRCLFLNWKQQDTFTSLVIMIFGHIFVNLIFGTGPLSFTFSHTPALRPPHAHKKNPSNLCI